MLGKNDFIEFDSVKFVTSGGESFRSDCIHRLLSGCGHKIIAVNVYGPAECACISTGCRIEDKALNNDSVTIGMPIWNKNVYIIDEDGNVTERGQQGMICIGGKGIFDGYIGESDNNTVLVRDTVTGNGMMYMTGDIGKINDDGEVFFSGRVDNQVKVNGQRIETEELEKIFAKHPDVRNCAYKIFNNDGDKRYVMFYVPNESGKQITYDEASKFMNKYLPKSLIPGQFVCIPEIPLNSNGKVNRKMLGLSANDVPRKKKYSSKNKLASGVIRAWKETLGTDDIDTDKGFLESGGTSLLYYRLQSAILKNVGFDMSITDILQYSTVDQQVDFLKSRSI